MSWVTSGVLGSRRNLNSRKVIFRSIIGKHTSRECSSLSKIILITSFAWIHPMTPGRIPSTPPSAQDGTNPEGEVQDRGLCSGVLFIGIIVPIFLLFAKISPLFFACVFPSIRTNPTTFVIEHTSLSFKLKNRTIDIGFFKNHTGIIDQITCWKIICTIDDNVIIFDDIQCIFIVSGTSKTSMWI